MKIPEDIRQYVRKRRLLRIALWILCMGLFSFAFFSSWDSLGENTYTEIKVAIYIGVLLVSILSFGIPKLIFEKSFIGKIVHLEVEQKTESDIIRVLYRKICVNAVIELESGKRIYKEIASKRTQRLNVPSILQNFGDINEFIEQYTIGDTVVFIAGTKFCQVYSEEKESLTCVICGKFSNRDSKNCEYCGHTIVKG